MKLKLMPIFILFILIQPLAAAELTNETAQAWARYYKWADTKVQRELSDRSKFLRLSRLSSQEQAEINRKLESGEIVVRRMAGVVPQDTHFEVPAGEIHHWWGAILLRDTTMSGLMDFLQDYDNHAGKFADVERSKLISKNGNDYRVYFRFRRTKIITAVYNTEQDCRYTFYGPDQAASQSIATRIAEVQDPGKPSEREKTPGKDSGYLWKLVSWWRFEQKGKDVLVELESASLSRDIPTFIKFIPGVSSYIRSTPKESLQSVLESIRKAVGSRQSAVGR